MPLLLNGKKYNGITLTGDRALETYAENTPPPADVQNGRVYFANGEKFVGTGRCFECAGYGSRKVQSLLDENNNERYGISIFAEAVPNIILITSTPSGDVVMQTKIIVSLTDETVEIIGENHTSQGTINAFYENNRLVIYFENTEDIETKINYFYGKDNLL